LSFPEIPDIKPCINLSLEETISMLIDSIVQEEKSLSNLMDAEWQLTGTIRPTLAKLADLSTVTG